MKIIALAIIKFYQKVISPFFPGTCRYTPTCSAYAREAFLKYNFFKALFLSVKRLIKCNPFGGHGYDPLPEDEKQKNAR